MRFHLYQAAEAETKEISHKSYKRKGSSVEKGTASFSLFEKADDLVSDGHSFELLQNIIGDISAVNDITMAVF